MHRTSHRVKTEQTKMGNRDEYTVKNRAKFAYMQFLLYFCSRKSFNDRQKRKIKQICHYNVE